MESFQPSDSLVVTTVSSAWCRLAQYIPLVTRPCDSPRKDTHAYYFAMNSGKKVAAALAAGTGYVTSAVALFA